MQKCPKIKLLNFRSNTWDFLRAAAHGYLRYLWVPAKSRRGPNNVLEPCFLL